MKRKLLFLAGILLCPFLMAAQSDSADIDFKTDTCRILMHDGGFKQHRKDYSFSYCGRQRKIGPMANRLERIIRGNNEALKYLNLYQQETRDDLKGMLISFGIAMPGFITMLNGIAKGSDGQAVLGGMLFFGAGIMMEVYMFRIFIKSEDQHKNLKRAVHPFNSF